MDLILGFASGLLLALIIGFLGLKFLLKFQTQKFELLAAEILKKNSEEFQVNANEKLTHVVNPLELKVKEYKEYMDSLHREDLKDRESLRERLAQMLESAQKIGHETGQLTRALSSDVKFQGAWGELTLERILELAGLQKDIEYFTQTAFKDQEGKQLKPDVVIKLPGEGNIIIDSKVSLKAYFDYMNSENKDEALKALKQSVQTHIDTLSKKNYQHLEGIDSPDFVYLFIPVEGVYSLILASFPEIIAESIKKNIVLVSPVNIMSNLRTVAALWRLEKQSKNAVEMANKAGAMYDKFVTLVDDIEKLGLHLGRAQASQDQLIKKISTGKGNLVNRAQELQELGAKTTKTMSKDVLD